MNTRIDISLPVVEEVTSGSIAINVKASFETINKTLDLCEEASSAGKSCPIEAGILTINATVAIPSIPIITVSLVHWCVIVC